MQTTVLTDSTVDIVIVTWNSASTVGPCVASVTRPGSPGNRITVVDNASSDSTRELLNAHRGPHFQVISNPENRGFAAACNQGAKAGQAPAILFLNPDCELAEGTVESMRQLLLSDASVAAVGGHLLGTDGSPQRGFTMRSLPRLIDLVCECLLINQAFPGNPWNRRYRMLDASFDRNREVEQPAGACFLIRRPVFDELGGFDERFHPAWFEDVDLCRRLRARRKLILFCAAARARHAGGSSLRSMPEGSASAFFFHNMLRFSRKHWGFLRTLLLRGALAGGMLERILLVSISSSAWKRYSTADPRPHVSRDTRSRLRRTFWKIFLGATGQWRLS